MRDASAHTITTVGGALLVVGALLQPSLAHDWYKGKKDPVTRRDCCDRTDCEAVDPNIVRSLPGGNFRVGRFFIPRNRVQKSEDNNYHLCRRKLNPNSNAWLCFFAPQSVTFLDLRSPNGWKTEVHQRRAR